MLDSRFREIFVLRIRMCLMIQTVLIGLMVNAHSVHLVLILGLMESVN